MMGRGIPIKTEMASLYDACESLQSAGCGVAMKFAT